MKKTAGTISLLTLSAFLLGFMAGLMVFVNIGIDPIGTLNQGIATTIGISFGTAVLMSSILFVLLGVIFERSHIHVGTLITALLVGVSVDFGVACWQKVIDPLFLEEQGYFAKIPLLFLSFVGIGVTTSTIIYLKKWIGPFDIPVLILSDKTGFAYGKIKVAFDLSCLAIGWLLGSLVGVGTLLGAICMGSIIAFCLGLHKKSGILSSLKGKEDGNG